ncbi:MAG: nickel pincer cofactor biosynthesis protein LarB [Pseudomonadota bacterium]|nr:nickel pincer cofactor biosynthesis protein LarB [Pseudomonadota bacterium]
MSAPEVIFDVGRGQRIGLDEAVFAAGKSTAHLVEIIEGALADGRPLLLTRLAQARYAELPDRHRALLAYCPQSCTATAGPPRPVSADALVAVVCAGTSDMPVAREALVTLRHHGEQATLFADVGVAGLWRLTSRLESIRRFPVIVAVAGMDAALPTVLGGLVASAIVAVPTSVGYGVAAGGHSALHSMLSSCAPGVAVVNIDNGYGAACAALRTVNALRRWRGAQDTDASAHSASVIQAAA